VKLNTTNTIIFLVLQGIGIIVHTYAFFFMVAVLILNVMDIKILIKLLGLTFILLGVSILQLKVLRMKEVREIGK